MGPKAKAAPSSARSKVTPSKTDISKTASTVASNSGTTTPIIALPTDEAELEAALKGIVGPGGKPDKNAYDEEQEQLRKEIVALQEKQRIVREKIDLAHTGSGNEERNALKAELDGIKAQQGDNKSSRSKIFEEHKTLLEGIQKKEKDLQAAKSKTSFKSIAEVDAHIEKLNKQVESGLMKVADEKRALQEITSTRRIRRNVETFQTATENIEADRSKLAELKKQLDDPEIRALSDRFEAIRSELDELKKASDEAYAGRSKLIDERKAIDVQIKQKFDRKRASAALYRLANDRYWQKVNEDRTKRFERQRAQKRAEEMSRKKEQADKILEEARIPAFQAQIEDCQTLIDHFSGKPATSTSTLNANLPKSEVTGVPTLELREVEAIPEGAIVRKKKYEDEDTYFVGKKGKKGGKKPGKILEDGVTPTPAPTKAGGLHVPLHILSALTGLSIPSPASSDDVLRVIEDLRTKKVWFEANQARVSAENIGKAEAEIKRLGELAGGESHRGTADHAEGNGHTTPPVDGEANLVKATD